MNKSLIYIATIFTSACVFSSLTNRQNASNTNQQNMEIVQKDGTIVEFGNIRNRQPLNITPVYNKKTYALCQNNVSKLARLYK